MDELRRSPAVVFPKYDLGKQSRQIDRPIRTVYATIDRDGEQTSRAIPFVRSLRDWTFPIGRRDFTPNDL